MKPTHRKFIYAHNKRWGPCYFDRLVKKDCEEWIFVATMDQLSNAISEDVESIYFVHWSHKIPNDILESCECICFHMTDLPYGRGGSPLQNLILAGHTQTKLTALKMTEEMDAGPIYHKWPMSLDGSAQQIFERVSSLANQAIREMISKKMQPFPQEGEPTWFKRRTAQDSEIPASATQLEVFNYIRMLDANGYPHAFISHNEKIIRFTNATLEDGKLTATAHFEGHK